LAARPAALVFAPAAFALAATLLPISFPLATTLPILLLTVAFVGAGAGAAAGLAGAVAFFLAIVVLLILKSFWHCDVHCLVRLYHGSSTRQITADDPVSIFVFVQCQGSRKSRSSCC